jgi:hypothetical protein
MATFDAFVFMKRQSGGNLYMSLTISTIVKLLYFFSHLCAIQPEPHPEVSSEGIAIHLKSASKNPIKPPKSLIQIIGRPRDTKIEPNRLCVFQ